MSEVKELWIESTPHMIQPDDRKWATCLIAGNTETKDGDGKIWFTPKVKYDQLNDELKKLRADFEKLVKMYGPVCNWGQGKGQDDDVFLCSDDISAEETVVYSTGFHGITGRPENINKSGKLARDMAKKYGVER